MDDLITRFRALIAQYEELQGNTAAWRELRKLIMDLGPATSKLLGDLDLHLESQRKSSESTDTAHKMITDELAGEVAHLCMSYDRLFRTVHDMFYAYVDTMLQHYAVLARLSKVSTGLPVHVDAEEAKQRDQKTLDESNRTVCRMTLTNLITAFKLCLTRLSRNHETLVTRAYLTHNDGVA